MIRCPWCGAQNYAIDSWCASCSRHLDWAPPKVIAAASTPPAPPTPATPPAPPEAPLEAPPPARRRGLIVRALAVAAVAVAVALALPVASWLSAAGRAQAPALPATAMRPAATPSLPTEALLQPTPTPVATPEPTLPSPSAAPPDENSSPPSGPGTVPGAGQGDPATAVARFYQAVSSHDFAAAAALWTPRMQAQYPPAQYIDHRFAATQAINLRADRTLGGDRGLATVYVDVIEVIDGQTRHWVGTWQLVDTASGWLLNRPTLRAAA